MVGVGRGRCRDLREVKLGARGLYHGLKGTDMKAKGERYWGLHKVGVVVSTL